MSSSSQLASIVDYSLDHLSSCCGHWPQRTWTPPGSNGIYYNEATRTCTCTKCMCTCMHVWSTPSQNIVHDSHIVQLTVSSVCTSSEVKISVSAVLEAAGGVGEEASGRVSLAVE